jgi:phosphopantothenoylcysteine synthetase/decarboxylase
VLYLILCGGRPAIDAHRHIPRLRRRWDVCVVATPQARKFIDPDRLAELSGHPVRSEWKHPDDPDELPPPDAIVVAPATFNTINKWAAGIADTLALGLLSEALGLGLPIVAAPFPNIGFAHHPVFARNLGLLRESGVRVLYDPEMYPELHPRTGAAAAAMFDWERVMAAIEELPVSQAS